MNKAHILWTVVGAMSWVSACGGTPAGGGPGTDSGTLDSSTVTDSGQSTDAATMGDTGATADSGSSGPIFFDASGTYDGTPFSVHCTAASPPAGATVANHASVTLGCTDLSTGYTVALGRVNGQVGDSTACGVLASIGVVRLSDTSQANCATSAATSFDMNITEWSPSGSTSLTWAGSFQMTSTGSAHTAVVSGTFRGTSGP